MTRPPVPELPPLISAPAQVRTSAGVPTVVPVTITNRSSQPRVFLISPAGVDSTWIPLPAQSGVVAPGETIDAELTLRPAEGTVAARYPLALAVQALDPVTGALQSGTTVHGVDLVVSAPGQVTLSLDPPDNRAVHSRKLFVVLQNTGQQAETVHLEARAPKSTAVDLARGPHVVPPASTMRIPARLTVARPTLFRRPVRHSFSVTARTSAAPKYAEGSLTARSVIGPTGAKIVAAIVVVALWVALALIFVPRLADKVRKPQDKAAAGTTLTVQPPGTGKKGSGKNGAGGSGAGPSGGGSGTGSGGAGAAGDSAASAAAKKVQITGTVSGATPDGVHVSIFPTTFGSADAAGAGGATTQSADSGPIGKLTPDAISHSSLAATPDQSGPAGPDGSFAFTVRPVGFYILQIAKPGYQTQRFVIDPTSAAAAEPMKIALVSGTGSLHGVVRDASGGNVGAATITITDGTNTVTTSTVSKGAGVGSWSVSGLSTPSSYLVSAGHDGLGVASRLVTLGAGATAPVALTMSSGVATLTGVVRAMIDKHSTGLGGITVTATDGTVTRTSTTVTTGSQTGLYTLPQLAVGTWTVSVSGNGYQLQTMRVKVAAGQKQLNRDVELTASTVTVTGKVTGLAALGLPGAGLTLSDQANTYKQTSLRHGTFSFAGVAPGTYTLTAEYSGYTSQTQTVKATLDAPVKHANFALKLFQVTHDSTIVGYAANAISSSSSFGCRKDSLNEPIGCTVYFQLFDSQGNKIAVTLDPTKPNTRIPSRNVSTLDGPVPYELSVNTKTKPGEAPVDGLAPGQYKLVISSPGFIPATVRVQVPLNGVAAMPEVSLLPANEIAGRIKASGDIDAQTIATDPPVSNCVLALPIGFNAVDPNRFFCDQAQADAASTPTSPAYGPDDVTKYADDCTFTGAAEPGVALTKNHGAYDLPRLCDGQYRLYPILGNRAYITPDLSNPIKQTVSNGQTVEYDPIIDRYPVLTTVVSDLDPNGNPTLAADTDVTLTCGSTVQNAHTDSAGSATFYGVPTGSPACTVGDADATSPIPSQFLEVNQTYTSSVVLVNRTMTLLGRIVSPYGNSATNPVAGIPVTVRAITGYNGSDPVWTSATTTTNDHGCFAAAKTPTAFDASAVDPAGTQPGSAADTNCGLLGTANIARLGATRPDVQVSTEQKGGPYADPTVVAGPTRALALTDKTLTPVGIDPTTNTISAVSSVATQSVAPNAVKLNGLKFGADNGSGGAIDLGTSAGQLSLANATFTVTPVAATGSGTITAGVSSTGQLTWNDSNVAANDSVWPGTYSYTLAVHGFKGNQSATTPPDPLAGQLTCGYDAASDKLACSLSAASLTALGNLTGTVTNAAGQIVGAGVYLDACGTTTCATADPPTTACPVNASTATYSTTTDPSGKYDFSFSGDRQLVPGKYRLIVCAAGRAPAVSEADIVSGTNPPTNVAMRLLGSFKGKLTGFGGVGLGSVAVTLSGYATSDTTQSHPVSLTTTTDGDGNFTFTDPDLGTNFLLPGDYTVAADPVGYQHATRTVTVTLKDPGLANDNDGSLAATALGGFSGTVSNSFGTAVKNATVTITCHAPSGTLACPSSAPTPATTNDNGRFTFIGGPNNVAFFLTPGTWQVQISAAGYADLLLDGSDNGTHNYQTINPGSNDNTGLVMSSLGGLAGTVTDSVTGLGVGNAVVTATCVASTPCNGAPAQTASTNGLGNYVFGTPGARDVFAYGRWTFTIAGPSGYHDATPSTAITFSASNVNPPDPGFQLRPLGTLSGKIVDSTDNTVPVGGATVRATCTSGCASPAPTVASVQTDTSGNFAFGTSGSRQVFADGTWTLSITGPAGYNNADLSTTYTFGDGAGQQVYSGLSLTLRPKGSLSGRIVDSTDNTVAVGGATVRATCTSGCGTTTPTVDAVQTDTSGNFAFGTSGSRQVFADGTWTLSITGPAGYNNADLSTTYTFGDGAGQQVYSGLSLTLRPKGSLSGTIVDATDSSLAVVGATLRASCTSDCATPTPTVSPVKTDGSGNFAFGAAGAHNVFADGTWTVTITGPSGYNNGASTTYTFGSGNGQQIYADQDFTLRPLGALTGRVSDSTTDAAVVGAVVHAACTSGCATPAPTVPAVATDGLGNYAFGVAGGRNVFADGTWTLSVTAPTGYKDSGQLTAQTVTFGSSSDTNQTADPIALQPYGSLTGTVYAVAAGTQRPSGLTVTLDKCSSSTDTTCAGTERTAVTGDTGTYGFGAVLDPGYWKLSTSLTGYSAASHVVQIVAGANNLSSMSARGDSPDLTLNYKPVDLPVKVVVTSTGVATKHAVVTFRRVDGGPVDGAGGHTSLIVDSSQAGGTPPIYTGTGLVPTAYNVTVTGDTSATGSSIQTTSVTIGVAPTDSGSAPELDINVGLLDFAVTGKVLGKIGDTGSSTTTAVTGARVMLLSSPPSGSSSGTVATDVNDNEIRTTTADSTAANPGSFTLPHVPNGTYYVSINQPDPDAPSTTVPTNGFAGSLVGPVTVLNGVYALGTQTLDAVYRQLTITVTHSTDDDLSGATPTLSVASGSSSNWVDRQPDSADLTTDTSHAVYTFNTVPSGCWTFALAGLSTTHKATLTQTTPSGSCSSGSFPVSAVQNTTAATAAFAINEHKLTISPVITVNSGSDPGTSATFTATVQTTGSPATTVATVTGISHGSATTDLYLPPARYTVTLSTTASTDFWTSTSSWSDSVDLRTSSDTAHVSATENALSSVHITRYSATPLQAGDSLTVTAICTDSQNFPTGCGSAATAPTQSDTGTGVDFTGLAPGSWTFKIAGTFQGSTITGKTITANLSPGGNSNKSWP